MIVICDTSVISSLIQINRLSLLHSIFDTILIPPSVADEITQLENFGIDLTEFKDANWIVVKDPIDKRMEARLLESLDKGESAAITLAVELQADYLAIDERAGRRAAKSLGITIIGLVGILIQAKQVSLIPAVKPVLDELISTAHFYIGEKFYQSILSALGEV